MGVGKKNVRRWVATPSIGFETGCEQTVGDGVLCAVTRMLHAGGAVRKDTASPCFFPELGPGLIELSLRLRVMFEDPRISFFPLEFSVWGAFGMASLSSIFRFLFDEDRVVFFRFVDVDSTREKKAVMGTSPRNGIG